MNDDDLLNDDDLAAAFRSVRDEYDGTNVESNTTLQRALFRTRTVERRQRLTRWVVLPIAAALAASTAWAGVTGNLRPAVGTVLEAFHTEHEPLAGPASATSAPPSPSAEVAANDVPPAPAETAEAPPGDPAVAPAAEPATPPSVAAPPRVITTAQGVATSPHDAVGSSGAVSAAPPRVEPPSARGPEAASPSASAACGSAADAEG
ncbi:MAG TPA: hypothetical protein VM204_00975, partial [Gaiellaceae bacterium]|nr:hypothetical protein [Gaiellaceae bacterium]